MTSSTPLAPHLAEPTRIGDEISITGEDALIIHEVFDDTAELEFHLTKGTAARSKKNLDRIAEPENHFFRGSVSRTIRTYSKIMQLPATYSSRGSHHTRTGGSMSDGTI